MKAAVYLETTGVVIGTVSGDMLPPAEPGTRHYSIPASVDPTGMAVVDGKLMPAAPDLDALRARRWADIKGRRNSAEWRGCATPLGRVDTDADSQRKVGGSVQMAMIAQAAGAPFALPWTMQDNSTVIHDAAAMIAMGVAVGQHVAACHEVAIAKRAEVDAAADVASIEAVDINEGWPA